MNTGELIFEVSEDADGGFTAECLTEPIFAQADNWTQLRAQVLDHIGALNAILRSVATHKKTSRGQVLESI